MGGDCIVGNLRLAGDLILEPVANGVLSLIEHLTSGDGLSHCDLRSGKVIMTADGAKLIDWTGAMRAPAPSTLRSVTFFIPKSPRRSSMIRSGRARSIRPRSPSMQD